MGLREKAALLASNLAVLAAIGFGSCILLAHA
jgi:hypothetical protein